MNGTEDAASAEARLWAASGAMSLTGRADGPPRPAPGLPATTVAEELTRLSRSARRRTGRAPTLPDVRLLSERAAIAGLRRRGPLSCSGTFRTLPTPDGRIGLSLARDSDLDMVPALVMTDEITDPWEAVSAWARNTSTSDAADRMELLGLPGTAVPRHGPPPGDRDPVELAPGGTRPHVRERPLIIDFTALWAGPLCAHLLGLTGAEVVKVESSTRLDGARHGPRAFFDLLHGGHRSVVIDQNDPASRDALLRLVRSADLVLESSRPRALASWGLHADELVADGVSWLSISARGRGSRRVGFGDDVSVGAGLYLLDRDDVLPCGDALADPLTGVVAARAAAEALEQERAVLVDVSMHDVCRHVAAAGVDDRHRLRVTMDRSGRWQLDTGKNIVEVAPPQARRPAGPAAAAGAHTQEVLW
ncbi:CoA transferase [Streptomyces hirsutus]|uniref:CoA transferase n=1 Tax=Streptomyces hirsutus TaxID=35620 RepID=UPI00363471EB